MKTARPVREHRTDQDTESSRLTMSTQHPTPLPWHQRTAQTLTFGTLSALVILGPFTAAGYLINTLGY